MMDSQYMNMACLELFDQELLNDDSPAPIQPTTETEPKIAVNVSEGNNGRKAKKRKQSFEETRKDNTEMKTKKTRLYELDPDDNKYSQEERAQIRKAIKSKTFRKSKMEQDNLKDDLITHLTAQNKILSNQNQEYVQQLNYKDKVIQEKDEIILQCPHCSVQNGLAP